MGGEVPVLRLPAPAASVHGARPPLAASDPRRGRSHSRRSGAGRFPTSAEPGAGDWLDGEHWLQAREGRSYKVVARTGRAEPYLDNAGLAKALGKLSTIDAATAARLAGVRRPAPGRRGDRVRGAGD